MTIGELIKKYRKENKITLRQLGKELGVTHEAIRKLENNDFSTLIPLKRLDEISKVTNIPFDELVKSIGIKKEYKGEQYYNAYIKEKDFEERNKKIY